MRAVSELTFDQSCAVSRNTQSSNGFGGFTDSWSTVATVQAHIREESGPNEAAIDPSMRARSRFMVWLPYATDVRPTDRLIIGAYTYEVTDIDIGKSWNLCLQAHCVRIEA
jgi:head-tail adaptor